MSTPGVVGLCDGKSVTAGRNAARLLPALLGSFEPERKTSTFRAFHCVRECAPARPHSGVSCVVRRW